MKSNTPRKQPEEKTPDGFVKMRVTVNLSLPCRRCKKNPREFFWKFVPGEQTIVYCLGCPRG